MLRGHMRKINDFGEKILMNVCIIMLLLPIHYNNFKKLEVIYVLPHHTQKITNIA